MKKFILSLMLILYAGVSFAQFTISDGSTGVAPVVNQSGVMVPRIYVNFDTMPKKRPARSGEYLSVYCEGTYDYCYAQAGQRTPNRYQSDVNGGSFRESCKPSHFAYDDPIVYPGQRGRTHLHQFAGNDSTSSASDTANMENIGKSTCNGGTLNRSGYWWPPLIYHCPSGSTNGCTTARNGEVIPATDINFYYKCAMAFSCSTGGNGGTPVQWFPIGFNVVAGNPNATEPQDSRILWRCNDTSGEVWRGNHIPNASEMIGIGTTCIDLEVSVAFPVCWDGVNAKSPGLSQSHVDTAAVAYSYYYTGCQGNTAFPVLLPELGPNIHFRIKNADIKYARLSSDWAYSTGRPAGITMHVDYIHGWADHIIPAFGMNIKDAIRKECYSVDWGGPPYRHSDCHNHLLGDPAHNNKWWIMN